MPIESSSDATLVTPEQVHQELERLLAFVVLVQRQRLRVRHRFRQFEVAVVVEHRVQAHRRACGRLQVVQVLEAAAGALRQLLRAGQVLAAVRQGFGFLLEQAEFLEVVRREADKVALAGHGDLERLANPPGRVGREAGAVADVESVDGLHQAADGFLKKVGITQRVMAETLGDVGGQTDVRRGELVLAVDVAFVGAA